MTDGQVTHLVIALGSNYQADTAFACAVSKLQKFGEMRLSLLVTGSDFTGRSQRVYHNAVAHIALTKSMQYTDIETTLKQIEQACGRDPAKNVPSMTMRWRWIWIFWRRLSMDSGR